MEDFDGRKLEIQTCSFAYCEKKKTQLLNLLTLAGIIKQNLLF